MTKMARVLIEFGDGSVAVWTAPESLVAGPVYEAVTVALGAYNDTWQPFGSLLAVAAVLASQK